MPDLTHKPPAARGRPKDPEKREAIFEAARRLFREKGYGNTSMQEIADVAGVSKLTLYSHFEDKDDLFRMALEHLGKAIRFDQNLDELMEKHDPYTALLNVARFVVATLTSYDSLCSQRMVLAEIRHFPHISRAYVFAGLDGFLMRLEDCIRAIEIKHPGFRFKNPRRSTCFFYGLIKGDFHPRFLYDVSPPAPEEVDNYLQDCVTFFLDAHREQKAA